MIGVYCIENTVNNRKYIGQSIHLETRKDEHFKALRRGNHFNKYLQHAFDKYGEENFVFRVLEECTSDELSGREIFWISKFGGSCSNLLYNLAPGGHVTDGENNPNYGKHWSEEWRSEQSKRMKDYFSNPKNHPMYGKHHSEDTVNKIRESLSGRKQPDEINSKRSSTMKAHFENGMVPSFLGRKHTDETKAKLREISSNHRHSDEVKSKMREIRKGSFWVTDGQTNRLLPKDSDVPEGFHRGLTQKKSKCCRIPR